MKKPVIFSFFSGSGFLDLGFENNGFSIDFVNEYHKPFLDAYIYSREKLKKHTPKFGYSLESIDNLVSHQENDILMANIKAVKDTGAPIGFIGGPPCPDFSVGGKNKGKDGENGKLTEIYINAVIKYQPDFFVFENVKGLWRTKRHREFYEQMKQSLNKSGYILTERLTNSLEYGVPQDRDRILLFGILKEKTSLKNNEELLAEFNWGKEIKFDRETVLNKSLWPAAEAYFEDSEKSMPSELSKYKELTVQHWFSKNQIDSHPNASHHFTPRAGLPRFQTIDEGDDSRKSYKRLHRWRYSPTAAYGNNEVHLHPYKSRRISAAEALAIQSLPADFELPSTMSLSNMFKTIGNGVPYLLSSGLAKTILAFLKKQNFS